MQISASPAPAAAPAPTAAGPANLDPQIAGVLQSSLDSFVKAGTITEANPNLGEHHPETDQLGAALTQAAMGFEMIGAAAEQGSFGVPQEAAASARAAVKHLSAASDVIKAAHARDAELPSGHEVFVIVNTETIGNHLAAAVEEGINPLLHAMGFAG